MGMNIGIDRFRELANAGLDRVVARDGRVQDGTQTWLGRKLGFGKSDNRQTMEALKQALTSKYGDEIARVVMNDHFGRRGVSEGTPLSSRDIRQVLDTAHQRSLRANRTSVMFMVIDGLPDSPLKAGLQNAVANMSITSDILAHSPMGPEEVAAFKEMAHAQREILQAQLDHLEGMADIPAGAQNFVNDIKQELRSQLQQLTHKEAYVDRFVQGDPLSQRAVAFEQTQWESAAIRILQAELADTPPNSERAGAITRKIDELQRHSALAMAHADPNQRVGNPAEAIEGFTKRLTDDMKEFFAQAGIPAGDMKKRLNDAHILELNHGQAWTTVTRDVEFTYKGEARTFQSRMRPACEMGAHFHYAPGEGRCSQSTAEAAHAVNLWTSTLQSADGQTLFRGVRHGIHSAYGIPDRQQRTDANRARAAESVQAVVAANPELLQRAQAAGPGDILRVPMTSISLVTPDAFRSMMGSKNGNERAQLQDQVAAWRALDGHPMTIEVDDGRGGVKQVQVQPDIIALNFGVNTGALHRGLPRDLAGGWGFSNAVNREGLAKLMGSTRPGDPITGRVGDYLAHCTPQQAAIVRKLVEQIRRIYTDKSYMFGGNEPFKMVKRLAVLANMLDGQVLYNCKSGKDRTGELDAEAKHLAAQIHMDGIVPEPDRAMTVDDTQAFREFALNGGNHEVQRFNTGVAGYKTDFAPITDQLGSPDAVRYHRGGSKFVHA